MTSLAGCTRAGCGWVPNDRRGWPTRGALACAWAEKFCVCGSGEWLGKPLKLRTDQVSFFFDWYEHCPECDRWRYSEFLKGAATGDGKTQLIAATGLLDMAGPEGIRSLNPNVIIMAASFDNANMLFGNIGAICGGKDKEFNTPLRHLFDVYDTKIHFADGRPGEIQRIAAVGSTNHGGNPSLVLADEIHELGDIEERDGKPGRKAEVYGVVSKSALKRMSGGGGRVGSLSTAGGRKEGSLLGAILDRGLEARSDPDSHPRFYLNWREARPGLNYDRAEDRDTAVRDASGAADVLFDVGERVRLWGDPKFGKSEWIRYFANVFPGQADGTWLEDQPLAWDNAEVSEGFDELLDDEKPFVVGVDMALRHDSAAVTRVQLADDGRFVVTMRRFVAVSGKIDFVDVENHLRAVCRGNGFRGVAYDPRFFELMSRKLEDEGIAMVEFAQSPEKMSPACGFAYQMIVSGRIAHTGDAVLKSHVLGAVKRQQERGFTLGKKDSKVHIDGCIAMCMALWVLNAFEPSVPPTLIVR